MKNKLLMMVLFIVLFVGLSLPTYANTLLDSTQISTVDTSIQISFDEFMQAFDELANTPNKSVYSLSDFFVMN